VIGNIKELFFRYEDAVQEKSVLVGVAPESMVGVRLSPEFYDDSGTQKLKVLITVEVTAPVDADEDLLENISDTISDFLDDRGDVEGALSEIGFDRDLLDWYPVKFVEV
jgi:hypothetical protein